MSGAATADHAVASTRSGRWWRERSSGPTAAWLERAWYLLLPIVALVIVQPMFGAALGAIDDHEVPMLLGPTGHLPLVDVPATIVRFWIEPDRFRPVYWVVRVFETAAWGENATGWYLDRLGLLIVTMGAAASLLRGFVPAPVAVLGAVLVVAGPQAENWFRLGPQEAIGTPVLLMALALLVRGRTRPGLALLVVAACTKEAFIPFAAAGCLLGWRNGDRAGSIVTAGLVAAAGAWVLYLHATAPDLYLQARSRHDMLDLGIAWARTTAAVTLWPVTGAVALIRGWRPGLAAIVISVGLALTQVYLYAGVPEPHYLLPIALLPAVATAFALGHLARTTRVVATVLAVAVACAAGYAIIQQRSLATDSAAVTVQWAGGLTSLRTAMAADPGAPVIVMPGTVWDEEPIYSLRRFVPAGRAMIAPAELAATTPEEVKLQGRLLAMTQFGLVDSQAPWATYVPYAASPDCILVKFDPVQTQIACPRTVLVFQP
jgi:hypothetical protein